MQLSQYVPLAIRTESPIKTIADVGALSDLLTGVVSTGESCDSLKRKLFYRDVEPKDGKPVRDISMVHGILGISSEVGEIAREYVEAMFGGRPLDTVNIKEELGDILWYIAIMCNYCGISPDDIPESNIAKLAARYKKLQLTEDAALNRNLNRERHVLEATDVGPMEILDAGPFGVGETP